jgi:hypothetical protein
MRSTSMLATAALLLGLGACDGATGTAAGDARAEVAVVGDGGGASHSTAPAEGERSATGGAEGEVSFRARVYLRSSTGAWVALAERAEGTVDAAGRGGAQTVATTRLRAGSYNRVRVVFERVDAHLSGGLHLSTGVLTGTVTVRAASGSQVVVERDANVSASAGATTRVLVDLATSAWLTRADAETRTVSEADFRSAVRITAH